MNRGLKLIATFWIFATAIAAGQLLRTIALVLINDFARGNPGLGSAIVTVIAVAPVVLVTFLTRAWRQDLRVLRQTDYWKALFEAGAKRVREVLSALAPSVVRNRPSSDVGGNPGARGFFKRNRLALSISLGVFLVTLALLAAYEMSRDRSGEWVTIPNPKYTADPTWSDRIRAIKQTFQHVAWTGTGTSANVDRVRLWNDPEYGSSSEVAAEYARAQLAMAEFARTLLRDDFAALPQAIESFDFMTAPAGNSSSASTQWRIRFKLPAEIRDPIDTMYYPWLVETVALVALTDREGYTLDTAEWVLNDDTFPDLGRGWSCLGSSDKERRLKALGPILVFKGSDEGDFLPGQVTSINLTMELRYFTGWQDHFVRCMSH